MPSSNPWDDFFASPATDTNPWDDFFETEEEKRRKAGARAVVERARGPAPPNLLPTAQAEGLGEDPGAIIPAARQGANLMAGPLVGAAEWLGKHPTAATVLGGGTPILRGIGEAVTPGTNMEMQQGLRDEQVEAMAHGHAVAQGIGTAGGVVGGLFVPGGLASKAGQLTKAALAAREVGPLATRLGIGAAEALAGGGEGALQGYLGAEGADPEEQLHAAELGGAIGLGGAAAARGLGALGERFPQLSKRLFGGGEDVPTTSTSLDTPPELGEVPPAPELASPLVEPSTPPKPTFSVRESGDQTYQGVKLYSEPGHEYRTFVLHSPEGEEIGYLLARKVDGGFKVKNVEIKKEYRGQHLSDELYRHAQQEMGDYLGSTDYAGRKTEAGTGATDSMVRRGIIKEKPTLPVEEGFPEVELELESTSPVAADVTGAAGTPTSVTSSPSPASQIFTGKTGDAITSLYDENLSNAVEHAPGRPVDWQAVYQKFEPVRQEIEAANPQGLTLYRSHNGDSSSPVLSWTADKKVADNWGGEVLEAKVQPKDIVGATNVYGQQEFFVNNKPEYIAGSRAAKPTINYPPLVTGVKNAVTSAERQARGLPEIELAARADWGVNGQHLLDRAKVDVDSGAIDPRVLATEISSTPRPLKDHEVAALDYDRMRLYNQHRDIADAIDDAMLKGDKEAEVSARQDYARVSDAIEANDRAARLGGTESGRGLAARRFMIKQDYSAASLEQKLRVTSGKPVSEADRVRIKEQAARIASLEQQLAHHEQQSQKLSAQQGVKRMQAEISRTERSQRYSARRAGRQASKEDLALEFDSLRQDFRRAANTPRMGLDPELVMILGHMARNRVQAGVVDAMQVADHVFTATRDLVDGLTLRDVMDAISGYGKTSHPSQDELAKNMREVNAHLRLFSAIEDVKKGERPLRSGYQRGPQSPKTRGLYQQLHDEMRRAGINLDGPIDPQTQMRSAMESARTRLKHQIEDLNREIKTGARRPKREPLKYDAEMMAMVAERDRLAAVRDKIDSMGKDPSEVTVERVRSLENSLEKHLDDLSARIKARDIEPRRPVVSPWSPKISKLRERQAKLNDVLETLRDGAKPIRDKAAERIAAAEAATAKSIADLEARIQAKDLSSQGPTSAPWSPELSKLKQRQAALQEKLAEMRRLARPVKDPETIRIQTALTRTLNRKAEIEQQVASGNFASKEKAQPLRPTPELMKARLELQQAKDQADVIIAKQALVNRTPTERALDAGLQWARFILLSSPSTAVVKIPVTAGSRFFTTPAVDAVAGVLKNIVPGLKKVAEQSPRYSSFSLANEVKAAREFLNLTAFRKDFDQVRQGLADTVETHVRALNPGTNVGRPELPPSVLDFFGVLHTLEKNAPYRAEFHRSLDYRNAHSLKAGEDITDPSIMGRNALLAYADANGERLLGDNVVHQAFQSALHSLGRSGDPGKVAAGTLKATHFPITKVATNYVGEVTDWTLGTPKAIIKLVLSRGLKNLGPEGADYVMRNISRNVTAAGMMSALYALGFFGKDKIEAGGYYREGEKRGEGDLKTGEMKIFGVPIPHAMQHIPALEAIQMAATIARVKDEYDAVGKEGWLGAGAKAAGWGLAEQVPFVDEAARAVHGMTTSGQSAGGSLPAELVKQMTIPPAVQRAARVSDQETPVGLGDATQQVLGIQDPHDVVKRYPQGFVDELKMGIPGLRQQVPSYRTPEKRFGLDVWGESNESSEAVTAPLQAELERVGEPLDEYPQPSVYDSMTKQRVKLKGEEYEQLIRDTGKFYQEALTQLFNDPSWATIPLEDQQHAVRSAMTAARTRATAEYWFRHAN